MINYSLLMILVPLVLSFIFILFQIVIIFHDSKINSIEYKLICSRYSKFNIIFSRIISIFVSLLIVTLIQNLFLFFFVFVNMFKLGLALFIANTFINSFIYLMIIIILIIITERTKKIPFIIVSIIIGILTLGLSLFSRPLIFKNYNFNYNDSNNRYRYIRLVDNKKGNVLIVSSNDVLQLNTSSKQIISI
ncbi:MAG: hypothetical protein K2L64_02380 [Ureaplasma sp.]|nr:hypothetical protein [Ureaplasma sp.]